MIPPRFTPELIAEYMQRGFWDDKLVADHVDENARNYPDKEALVDSRYRLTWSEVSRLSDRIALGLLDLGFRKDDLILEQLPNCAELYLLMVAGEKAGIIVVNAQPTFRHYEISAIAKRVKAKGIVIPQNYRNFDYFNMINEIRPELPQMKHVFVTGTDAPEGAISFDSLMQNNLESKYAPDYLQQTRNKPYEVWRVVCTSGTTGVPKLGSWETCPVKSAGRNLVRDWGLGPDDILGAFYNIIGGGLSIASVYSVALAAAKLVLLERFTAEGFCQLVESERITVAGIVPAEVAQLLEYPDLDKYDLGSLRLLAHSTTLLPRELALRAEKRLECKYVQTYGSADCGALAHNSANDSQEIRVGTVGRPYDGGEVKIINNQGEPVAPGEYGEILIKGPTTISGYFDAPELNEQLCRDGWLCTGNEGKVDEHGNIIVMGRRRDVIIRGGQNIYPKDIEELLLEHPSVREVAVVRMPDPVMGEKACAFIATMPGETITFDEVTEFLKSRRLAPFKLPERVELRGKLPRLPAEEKMDVISLEKEIAQLVEEEQRSIM